MHHIAALKAKGVDPFSPLLRKGKQIHIHEMRGWVIEKGSRSFESLVLPISACGLDCKIMFCKNARHICLVKNKADTQSLFVIKIFYLWNWMRSKKLREKFSEWNMISALSKRYNNITSFHNSQFSYL